MDDNTLAVDILIIGAGPSGLSAAIRCKQLCDEQGLDWQICVLEKGSEVGAHILAGAVLEPRALNELLPNWQELAPPEHTPVTRDHFLFLTQKKSFKLPTPPSMHNKGNMMISLGNWCRWLATVAESMGIEIYPGFAASEVLIKNDSAIGVKTADMGVSKQGEHKNNYQPGMKILAKQTLFAEGCRGSLTKQLVQQFELVQNSDPQTYAIGLKELWKIDPNDHQLGLAIHSIGWPLNSNTYGGGFAYHMHDNLLSIGLVVGLDYQNPYLSPYQEFQRLKHHPLLAPMLQKGQILSYGARALNEGGWQSIPKLSFDGGALIGCAAGFMNVPKIKGIHTAMKSGMLAAEAVIETLQADTFVRQATSYTQKLHDSWIKPELYRVRNIRPAFKWGLWPGLAYAAIDTYLFRGHTPWTLHHHADHTQLLPADQCTKIHYDKPDGVISFDRLTSVARTNVFHEEDQPCHLRIQNPKIPTDINYAKFAGPEQRYCPAGVYEYQENTQGEMALVINAQNCIHCKTCDIKDPQQNINWIPPEGGGGPNYSQM